MFGTLNLTQSTAPPWEYSTNCWFTEKIRSQTRSSLNQEVACLFLEQLIHTIILQYLFLRHIELGNELLDVVHVGVEGLPGLGDRVELTIRHVETAGLQVHVKAVKKGGGVNNLT